VRGVSTRLARLLRERSEDSGGGGVLTAGRQQPSELIGGRIEGGRAIRAPPVRFEGSIRIGPALGQSPEKVVCQERLRPAGHGPGGLFRASQIALIVPADPEQQNRPRVGLEAARLSTNAPDNDRFRLAPLPLVH